MKDSARGGVIVTVIILALVFYFAIWTQGCDTPSNGNGGREVPMAPDFEVETMDGDMVKLSDFAGEKAVVLDFFATWCGPCIIEMPFLQEFYAQYSDRVEVFAISDEGPDKTDDILELLDELEITFPAIQDTSQAINNLYPHRAIPFLVVIGLDGKIIDTHLGADPNIGNVLVRQLELDVEAEETPEETEEPVGLEEEVGEEPEVSGEAAGEEATEESGESEEETKEETEEETEE